MTHAMQMLMINAKYQTLSDEATSMLISFLNRDLLSPSLRKQVINACQKSCNLRMTETGLFIKE